MSGYWVVIAPVGLAGMAAVIVGARLLAPHHGARVAPRDHDDGHQGYDVATVPVKQTSGAPPWEEARLRAILAAEVDGIEPAPMPQYEAAPTLVEQLEPEQLGRRYELAPHVAAMAAAVREQHARSCPTCLTEQRPWYDPSWLEGQLGELFAWVRHMRGMT